MTEMSTQIQRSAEAAYARDVADVLDGELEDYDGTFVAVACDLDATEVAARVADLDWAPTVVEIDIDDGLVTVWMDRPPRGARGCSDV